MTTSKRSRRDTKPAAGSDGATGLLHGDRAMRAREVSKPSPADEAAARANADAALARIDERRQAGRGQADKGRGR